MDAGINMAFGTLKDRLKYPPFLVFLSFENSCQVQTDASSVAIDPVLSQIQSYGNMHPVHFVKPNNE